MNKKVKIAVIALAAIACIGVGGNAYKTQQQNQLAQTQYEDKIAQYEKQVAQYKNQATQLQANLDEKESQYQEQLALAKDTSYQSGYDEGYRVGYEKGHSETAASKSNASTSNTSTTTASTAKQSTASSHTEQSNSATVYITNTGSKYHRSGCSYLRQSSNAISLSQAKSSGYEPCSRCNPPS
jgi:hypothetical protein